MQGLILYGPPAVGKDAITEALSVLDSHYVLFPRIKVGAGRVSGYRMGTMAIVEQLRAAKNVVWENRRYGATYVIDRPELTRRLSVEIPVLHLGQRDGVAEIVAAIPSARWIVADLYCPRTVGVERIAARGTGDTSERITAWDETPRLPHPDISIDTGIALPEQSALLIEEVSR